jgi:hypothetical protein
MANPANPNAVAALFAGAVVTGVQWLVARYAHVAVSKYWSDVLTAGVTTAVLFIGRDGLKGALSRVWGGAKTGWSGSQPASTPDVTKAP